MKPLILVLALLFGPVVAQADTCIVDETSHQYFLFGFQTGEERVAGSESWIGNGRVAVAEEGRKMILDRVRGFFYYINLRDRSYVEIPLPVAPETVFSDELKRWYAGRRMGCEVESREAGREIAGRKCAEYLCAFWDYRDGGAVNPREMKVWATTETTVDLDLFDEYLLSWRLLHNRDRATRDELERIRGLQLGLEWDKGEFLRNEKIVNEVKEITEKQAPPGTYEVPPGLTRKTLLDISDFEGF